MSYFPLSKPLAPSVLDALLAEGWYRMRQAVFTTQWIMTEGGQEVEVLWARIDLNAWRLNRRHKKLMKCCGQFECSLQDAVITAEVEALFATYVASIDFETGPTVRDVLQGGAVENFFPTRMWTVRDNEALVAAGYLDEGGQTVAGILNFYHPDYRHYSLGLWLYLEGIRYAAESGKRFYYPGYIALDYTKFDYKLLAGTDSMEILCPQTRSWIPYEKSRHAAQHKQGTAYAFVTGDRSKVL
jgi:arginyl-tRNA--protein-N-Asp/Glu arginylyltransferase